MKPLIDLDRGSGEELVSDTEWERRVPLSELLALITVDSVTGSGDLEIRGITADSRAVRRGFIFAAIAGGVTDGHLFIPDAIEKGAVAVLSEKAPRGEGVAWIQTTAVRQALGRLASRIASNPSRSLDVVGITGTNGKTTTAYLVDGLLSRLDGSSAMMGTVVAKVGDQSRPTRLTTPEAPVLQDFLSSALALGCRHAVIEVSSHGLALHRLEGTELEVAVFTNLSRDHLDFHRDMEDYFLVKKKLFDDHMRPDGTSVICIDDAYGERLAAELKTPVLTYGHSDTADLSIRDIEASMSGTRVRFRERHGDTHGEILEINSGLLGRYNALNLVAAFAAVRACGYDTETVLSTLSQIGAAPGRFEKVETALPFDIIVDYAHTDDALRKLLEACRPLVSKRLWVVFGCGGERDRAKRPLMGDVAARLADRVVFTSDNPRGEDPEAILAEIQLGAKGSSADVEPDRRRAIELALSQASAGDLVVVAGKGHEPYQIVSDRVLAFDDREVIREIAARLVRKAAP